MINIHYTNTNFELQKILQNEQSNIYYSLKQFFKIGNEMNDYHNIRTFVLCNKIRKWTNEHFKWTMEYTLYVFIVIHKTILKITNGLLSNSKIEQKFKAIY